MIVPTSKPYKQMKVLLYKECWHSHKNGSQSKRLHPLGEALIPDDQIETAKLVLRASPGHLFRSIPGTPPELANIRFKAFVTSELFKDEIMMICE